MYIRAGEHFINPNHITFFVQRADGVLTIHFVGGEQLQLVEQDAIDALSFLNPDRAESSQGRRQIR